MALIKLSNNGVKNITSVGSIGTGELKFISKQTASSSASISFTSGIDSTYKEYIFFFKDIHPATDHADLEFNMSIDSGSNYNVTKTTSFFDSIHREDGTNGLLGYSGSRDIAQGTGFQDLMGSIGNGNDECGSGYLHIFNPSSTTFVKHFIAKTQIYHSSDYSASYFLGGYGNTTSAVDAMQFKMSSGNIDSGDILLYGVK